MRLVEHKPSGIRAAWRLLKLSAHIVVGCGTIVNNRLRYGATWYNEDHGAEKIRLWMQEACNILAVRVFTTGSREIQRDALLVANHVSWLDIITLSSITPTRFLSKDTLRYWPVIGWLTAMVGTLFIQRGKRHVVSSVLKAVRSEIKAGRSVVVFPEGTTTDGCRVRHFHAGLFELASEGSCRVQAMALRYYRNGDLDPHAPYIGNDNFILHAWRIASMPNTMLLVHVFAAVDATLVHRRELAEALRTDIETHLNGVSMRRAA